MTLRWRPDTCLCVFDLKPDGACENIVSLCDCHLSFDDAMEDNRFKNRIQKVLEDVRDEEREKYKAGIRATKLLQNLSVGQKEILLNQLCPDAEISVSYNEERKIKINAPSEWSVNIRSHCKSKLKPAELKRISFDAV